MEDKALELLKKQFDKIDNEHTERCKSIDRYHTFIKWGLVAFTLAVILQALILLIFGGVCKW